MSVLIGRQGYLGLALESVPGTAESTPTTFIPFTENSLQEKHEPLADISARASRVLNHDSQTGKQWGEGDIGMYVDATNLGYLTKMAFGNEAKTVVSGDVNDHLFYVTTSGNTPKTATLWNYRGSDPSVKQHTYSCADNFELEVTTDDIATVKVGLQTDYPTKVSAPTLATTSGTLLTWKDMSVKFGDTVASAESSTAIKVTNFKFTLSNNVESHYRAGSATPDIFTVNQAEVTGEYTLLLENDTEVDKYRDLTKKAMVITLTGADIGSSYTEQVKIVIHRTYLEDEGYETDLDGVWAINQSFRAIQGTSINPGFVDLTIRNLKTSVY